MLETGYWRAKIRELGMEHCALDCRFPIQIRVPCKEVNKMKGRAFWLVILLVVVVSVSCGPQPTPTAEPPTPEPPAAEPVVVGSPVSSPAVAEVPRTLTVMTHDSFDVSGDVVEAFKESCNCEVQFLQAGDTVIMLNHALLSKENTRAVVIYGVDNTFLSRALA